MKILYYIFLFLLLSSCAANYKPPAVTSAGSKVKITEKQPRGCRYLDELIGYHMRFEWSVDVYNMREKMEIAFNNTIRNKVAEMNGNTAVQLLKNHDAGMFTFVYAVQRCKV